MSLVTALLLTGCVAGNADSDRHATASHSHSVQEDVVAESVDQKTLSGVLQVVIDLEPLQDYYHQDLLPERKPLKILEHPLVDAGTKLHKFDLPVEFVSESAVGPETPYIEFTDISIDGDSARVAFRYDVEGIRGTAKLERKPSGWVLVHHRLVEA